MRGDRVKRAVGFTAIMGLLAGVAAVMGPFFTGESVTAVIERVRRAFRPRA
jgi:hypothetical protein